MKKTSELKLIILVLGLIFAISIISNFNLSYEEAQKDSDDGMSTQYDIILKSPKKSGAYKESFIHIDGSISDNWSLTESTYAWCSGNGSSGNPYIIENVSIDADGSGDGILIENSKNVYFIIRNCNVTNAGTGTYNAGIKLENTNNGTLMNNNCSDNGRNGILLINDCENNVISGNIACNFGTTNQKYGIRLYDYCDNNTISDNSANDNIDNGIQLMNFCDNNTISGNTVSNVGTNEQDLGIELYGNCNRVFGNTANNNLMIGIGVGGEENTISNNIANYNLYGICINGYENTISRNTIKYNEYGIYLVFSEENIISENTVNYNTETGLILAFTSQRNNITRNFIYKNKDGIYLEVECNYNLIFYNCIANNSDDNVFDCDFNHWNNSVIGNYWSDYYGVDADSNGIGDTAYICLGAEDYKPLMNYIPFFSTPPDDMCYEIGTTGHSIKWTAMDISPFLLSYNILRDGTSIKSDMLFTEIADIEVLVDGLAEGTYGFIININDVCGGANSDSVWVTVTNTDPIFSEKPNDKSYKVGQTENYLIWTFSDVSTNNPTYTITREGVPIIVNEPCSPGEYINISVDGLPIGTHGFTIEIDDGYGGTVLDGVWVTVMSNSNSNPSSVIIIEEEDDDDDDNDELVSSSIITASIIIAVTGGVIATAIILHVLLMKKRIVPETPIPPNKKQPIE